MGSSSVARRCCQLKLASDLSTDNLSHLHSSRLDFLNVFSNVLCILAQFQRLEDHTFTRHHLRLKITRRELECLIYFRANKIVKRSRGVKIWPKRMPYARLVSFHRRESVRDARCSILIEVMVWRLTDKNKRLLGISPFLDSLFAFSGMTKLRWRVRDGRWSATFGSWPFALPSI